MKALLTLAIALLLCSCAIDPQVHTSLNHNGQSLHSMDLTDPHFYMHNDFMDSDGSAPDPAASPLMLPHYSMDNFCATRCQGSGHSSGYCNRACGF